MITREQRLEQVLEAAIAYAEKAERHLEYHDWRTRTMQQAANEARKGNRREADRLRRTVDSSIQVFDYTDVHKKLIRAVKPLRKKGKK